MYKQNVWHAMIIEFHVFCMNRDMKSKLLAVEGWKRPIELNVFEI